MNIDVIEKTVVVNLMDCSMFVTKQLGSYCSWKKRAEYISDRINMYLFEDMSYNLLIDARGEAQAMVNLAKSVLMHLEFPRNKTKLIFQIEPLTDDNFFVGYNYTINQLLFTNYTNYYGKLVNQNIDWANILCDKYLISLNGNVSNSRALLTKELLDLCKDKIRASLGVMFWELTQGQLSYYKNFMQPYDFPLILDKKLERDKENDIPNINFFKCLFNVVNETHSHDEKQIFVTEKTYKAFAWHQIPIFNTVPGHVEYVRSLGFDTFDDILDGHKYDNNFSPNHHLKILSLVKKILDKYPTIDYINDLRLSLYKRLENNNQLLAKLSKQNVVKGLIDNGV